MRDRRVLLGILLAALIVIAPVAAQAHGPKKRGDRQLRRFETAVLGADHAREHARVRLLARKRGAAKSDPAAGRAVAPTAAGDRSLDGRWLPPFKIPVIGIHAVMLPTGKVLWFSYPKNANVQYGDRFAPNTAQAWLWDPATDRTTRVDPPMWRDPADGKLKPANIWCAAQGLMPDGRVLVVGGNLAYGRRGIPFRGLDKVYAFNPWNETWTEQPDMEKGRWYPSEVLLPDGRMLIIGGLDDGPGRVYSPNLSVELFTPSDDLDGVGTLAPIGNRAKPGLPANGLPPDGGLYPHLFAMPSGRVMVAGPDPNDSWYLNAPGPANAFAWSDFPPASVRRLWGTGVLVPQGPEGSTRVELLGGSSPIEFKRKPPERGEATATAEAYDEANPGLGWQPSAPLQVPRSHHNTVLLPDGGMVTVGGGIGTLGRNQWAVTGDELRVEIFDRGTGTWRLGAPQAEARAYHSTALLLPDARVVSAGDDYNGKNGPGSGIDNDRAEVYEPPYLFDVDGGYAERPAIDDAPATVSYGESFQVETADTDVTSASLVAPGATTHANDMSQRVIPLALSAASGGVSLTAPAGATIAPPGWHMLFLMNADGVPSVARWVLLGPDPPPLGRLQITAGWEEGTGAEGSPEPFRFVGGRFDGVELRDGESASAVLPGGPSTTVPGGHFGVTQQATADRDLVSVHCDDADSQTDVRWRSAMVHLAAGESVHCTFTSRPAKNPGAEPSDTTGPRISFSRVRGLAGRNRVLRGRASDGVAVRRVDVALARAGADTAQCRWWRQSRVARWGVSRSCRRPAWIRAELSGGKRKVHWRVELRRALRAGRYRLAVRSYDSSDNTTYLPQRGRTLGLRVPELRR